MIPRIDLALLLARPALVVLRTLLVTPAVLVVMLTMVTMIARMALVAGMTVVPVLALVELAPIHNARTARPHPCRLTVVLSVPLLAAPPAPSATTSTPATTSLAVLRRFAAGARLGSSSHRPGQWSNRPLLHTRNFNRPLLRR